MATVILITRVALCVVVCAATGCRSAGTAARPAAAVTAQPSTRPSLDQARELFYQAVEGDKNALRNCQAVLAGLPWEDPKVQAYRGACEMLEASRAPWPWDKGRHAKAGLQLLDGAVAKVPSDLEIRFVRGMTCYNLPPLFSRSRLAAEDLAYVAARAEAAAGQLDPNLAAASLYYYGEVRDRSGDHATAVELWRRAAALAPDSRAGLRSAEKLNAARMGEQGSS